MALLKRFDPPAFLKDVPASSPFYEKWNTFMSKTVGSTRKGDNGGMFFNATKTDVAIIGEKPMAWMGLSREILSNAAASGDRNAAYAAADADIAQRIPQIEYFEWRVDREGDKIRKVTFVTETADYYTQLWAVDRAAVVKLYQKHVSPAVTEADLHIKGRYNKFNRWNTTDGIMHYIHPVNSFFDAVGLSRDAAVCDPPFADNYEARPALAARPTSADPRISFDSHMMIRKGLALSLMNPIGLYIAGWENSGITLPDGRPAGDYWKIVRGKPGMVLRLEYEVPKEVGLLVGDLRIGGRPIRYGAQLAEHITVSLTAIVGNPKK